MSNLAAMPATDIAQLPPSGQRLRDIVQMVTVGMALVGMDGRIAFANNAFGAVLGYEEQGCVGLAIEELLRGSDGSQPALRIRRLMSGESQHFNVQARCLQRNGNSLWMQIAASILTDETGDHPVAILVELSDIDRQKRAEEALTEWEARWNTALEAAGQGVWDHNHVTGQKYHSPTWRRMRLLTDADPLPKSAAEWLASIHPDDRERVADYVRRQDAGEFPNIAFEFRERRKDGSWLWVLSRGKVAEWDENGVPMRIIGTDTDITDIKAVEAELAAEKERLRITLGSIGDGVISTNAEGRIIFMNASAEELTGWTSAEAVGRDLEAVFTVVDDAGETPKGPMGICLSSGELRKSDDNVILLGRDGTRYDIHRSASPVQATDGSVIGAVMVFQDITDSRDLQRKLAFAADHDSLTGLLNRSGFERILKAASEEAGRGIREYALCFIDIDHFKAVNDSGGHAAGDAMLQEIARVTRASCRSADYAARIGGDEFALLLEGCSLSDAARVATKLVDALASTQLSWQGRVYGIGASIGVTAITGGTNGVAVSLSEADAACYLVKQQGRGGVATFGAFGPQRIGAIAEKTPVL
ncbi:MAG TPA: PAS domain S-box protein [Devosiaceae bacterium]|jgi:diguanylate cyclase (GGDEF)-like protein/PAS domain S-box-containing protein